MIDQALMTSVMAVMESRPDDSTETLLQVLREKFPGCPLLAVQRRRCAATATPAAGVQVLLPVLRRLRQSLSAPDRGNFRGDRVAGGHARQATE